jgi:hypothetical protein
MERIENYDFLGSYNYAFMLYEMNIPELSDYVTERTVLKLNESIKNFDNQAGQLWAKFLSELFKYDLMKRSYLFKTLDDLLKISGNDLGIVNVVCTIL